MKPIMIAQVSLLLATLSLAEAQAQYTSQYTVDNSSLWNGLSGGTWGLGGVSGGTNWIKPTGTSANRAPQSQPEGKRHVLFYSESAAETQVVLNDSVALGFGANGGDIVVTGGKFNIELAGYQLGFNSLVFATGTMGGDMRFTNGGDLNYLSVSNVSLQGSGETYNLKRWSENLDGRIGGNINLSLSGGFSIGGNGGINNTLEVNAGEVISNSKVIHLKVGREDGESNNRLVVNGGTLNYGAAFSTEGFYSAIEGGGVIASNNNVEVKNAGRFVAINPYSGTGSISIGEGNRLEISSGGEVETVQLEIKNHALLDVTGDGSHLKTGSLTLNADALISDGANAEINSLWVKDNGSFEMNGGEYFGQQIIVNAGGRATFEGTAMELTLPTSGGNSIRNTGGLLELKGVMLFLETELESAYSAGTNTILSDGSYIYTTRLSGLSNVTVEEGSTLYVEDFVPAFTTNGLKGRIIVNKTSLSGGLEGGNSETGNATRWAIDSGTIIQLGGGDYNFDGRYRDKGIHYRQDGYLTIQGVLEGSGNIGFGYNYPDGFEPNRPPGDTIININGGEIDPGVNTAGEEASGILKFRVLNKIAGTAGDPTVNTFTFDLFGVEDYDQIWGASAAVLSTSHTYLNININLWEDRFSDEDFSLETVFALLRTSEGEAWDLADFDLDRLTFNFGDSVDYLASLGYMWDTSQFAATGVLGIQSIPEPGTYGMLLIGAGALGIWRRRRQRQAA